MTEPYIPGFLAFREVNFLLERLEAVKTECPQFLPQVHVHCVPESNQLLELIIGSPNIFLRLY